MAVTLAYRRLGIATALIQRVGAYWWSQGLATLRIDVYADNRPAVKAYEKLGFRVYDWHLWGGRVALRLKVASPEQLAFFKAGLQQERLEWMTCRPVMNGQRVAPSDKGVTLAFFVNDSAESVGKFSYFDVNPRNRSAEFEYRIHPAMRGAGMGDKGAADGSQSGLPVYGIE